MSDDLGKALLRELVRALPQALDDDTLEELAARLGPHLHSADPSPTLLSAADAAKRANVHVETIRRAIRAGELDIVARIGRSVRLTTNAVDEWLARTSQPASRGLRARPARPSRRSDLADYSLTAAFKTTT